MSSKVPLDQEFKRSEGRGKAAAHFHFSQPGEVSGYGVPHEQLGYGADDFLEDVGATEKALRKKRKLEKAQAASAASTKKKENNDNELIPNEEPSPAQLLAELSKHFASQQFKDNYDTSKGFILEPSALRALLKKKKMLSIWNTFDELCASVTFDRKEASKEEIAQHDELVANQIQIFIGIKNRQAQHFQKALALSATAHGMPVRLIPYLQRTIRAAPSIRTVQRVVTGMGVDREEEVNAFVQNAIKERRMLFSVYDDYTRNDVFRQQEHSEMISMTSFLLMRGPPGSAVRISQSKSYIIKKCGNVFIADSKAMAPNLEPFFECKEKEVQDVEEYDVVDPVTGDKANAKVKVDIHKIHSTIQMPVFCNSFLGEAALNRSTQILQDGFFNNIKAASLIKAICTSKEKVKKN